MANVIEKDRACENAIHNFQNGYHCAEAVVAAALEELDRDPSQAIAHAAAFGGGFGRTFNEACGALSGSLIVIGDLYARKGQGESWDDAAGLGAQIREIFIHRYGTTRCRTLRDRFGEENQEKECGVIVGRLAADLVDLLQAKSDYAKNTSGLI